MESGVDVAAASSLPLGEGSGLSDRDLRILEFERQWWRYAGAKEQAIRELFECSTTRYYQMLNTLIDDRVTVPVNQAVENHHFAPLGGEQAHGV